MKNIIRLIGLVLLITAFTVGVANAEKYVGDPVKKTQPTQKAAECVPATGSSQLNVNNVRAYIETSGSMWFRTNAQYFIPKEGQASSMFAAALWIGGMDVAGQLKLAAITFRQRGNDFWPGPLTLSGATIDQSECALYDRHFVMTKKMAKDHMLDYNKPGYVMPNEIKNWPGNPINGDAKVSWFIAPYVDADGDGSYTPDNGDYPYYDFDNDLCPWTAENKAKAARGELPQTPETIDEISSGGIMADQVLKGDQTLWWIFNDKGAAHTESKGVPIGLEIRAQAFAFATTDDLNNMTFYSYEIINRSSFELTETYFSQWVDPDLGYAKDDYVGCDVRRGLGYCYNGKTPDGDGLITHYGENPPAVGVDFFQGPYLDPDGYDNPSYNGDGIYGPSFVKDYPGGEGKGCAIVTQNGNALEFTWDSTGNGDIVTRYVIVRAEAINGVNFGDGIVDNERYGMRRFVYHENKHDNIIGDPQIAIDYYNFLRGIWKNNAKMTYGGTGYNPGSTIHCDFMFPGHTDPCNWGTNGKDIPGKYASSKYGWTEEEDGNQYGDRRFMQSAGPFTLKKGAINYITVGIPWARATGSPWKSVELLKIVDDKAQNLFESCFKVVDGPDAPDLKFREMDGKLICYITNAPSSSNYKEGYIEKDNTIPGYLAKTIDATVDTMFYSLVCDTLRGQGAGGTDSIYCHLDSTKLTLAYTIYDTTWYDQYYRFEGYQVYQLADPTVGPADLSDESKAELVFQCDIKNGVKQIINFKYDARVATEVPIPMVDGKDQGVTHSFEITEDRFATGSGKGLVNYKKYYYMAIAYAYNSYASYSTDPGDPDGLYGQKNPYLPGNKNIQCYTVLPHKTAIEENGTIAQAIYGTQPQIIQFEGHGNGSNSLSLTKQTINEILKGGKVDSLIFEKNAGPINVRVVDPLKVVGKDYTLRFINKDTADFSVNDSTYWVLEYEKENGIMQCDTSEVPISIPNEQLLLDLGISIFIENAKHTPLEDVLNSSQQEVYRFYSTVNLLGSSISYQNPAHPWFSAVQQQDGTGPLNWIRAGQTKDGDWQLGDPNKWNPNFSRYPSSQTYEQKRKEDFYFGFLALSSDADKFKEKVELPKAYTLWYDKSKQFARVVNGTFAPYALTSYFDNNPAWGFEKREGIIYDTVPLWATGPVSATYPLMTELYSVDIVLTADTNLWTRCPVVELADDSAMVKGAIRHNLRKAPSVYRNGEPMNDGTEGMGWFPGYVICVETGERLNVMFGENSMYGQYNGANMIFDPYPGNTSNAVYLGRHYLYIFGHRDLYQQVSENDHKSQLVGAANICPAYDEGKWLYAKLKAIPTTTPEASRKIAKNFIYKNAMWTSMVTANSYYQWLENGNDVTIKIRVTRPYSRWNSRTGVGKQNDAVNNDMPLYKFSTKDIATLRNQKEVAVTHMESVNIVPNPYYGIATGGYEASQVDTRVKFINLPKSCKIKIYTLNGTLIRQFDFNSPDPNPTNPNSTTFLEWDLKNSANIPIASGIYMIHIQDNETNAIKTLKFMCIQRPIDVNAF